MKFFRRLTPLALGALLTASACTVADDSPAESADTTASAQPAAPAAAPVDTAPPLTDISLEVDLASRQVHVIQGGQRIAQYGVAVGSAEWPTQTGQWTVKQVVWNPEWIPPTDESWTEDKDPQPSGDPDNPLGRVQLVYDLPRTIHGTNNPASIGKAVSHA